MKFTARNLFIGTMALLCLAVGGAIVFVVPNLEGSGLRLSVDGLHAEVSKIRPLTLDPELNATASQKCAEMAATDFYDHGDDWADKLYVLGRQEYGENLAEYYETSADVVAGWMGSPAHAANIMNGKYARVGYAVCFDGDVSIAVQHFSD